MTKDDILAQIYDLDFKISEAQKLTLDPEMSVMAYEEINKLTKQKEELEKQVDTLPSFENYTSTVSQEQKPSLDTRNAIIEVKGAAGGDEASIFARELLRMYVRYCERHAIQKEILDEYSIKI